MTATWASPSTPKMLPMSPGLSRQRLCQRRAYLVGASPVPSARALSQPNLVSARPSGETAHQVPP
jgi:hypothetical protein